LAARRVRIIFAALRAECRARMRVVRTPPRETIVNKRRDHACVALGLAVALAAAPRGAGALELLDRPLSLDDGAGAALHVALAAAPQDGPSLDFDLLGDAPRPEVPVEDRALRTRRKMLTLHQGVGIGLLGLQIATTTVGQLNYDDKFGIDNTARYKQAHQVLAWSNLAAFALTGGLALFAPSKKGPRTGGVDRVTVHKVAMAVATAGMLAQGLLGVQTARREGYVDKQDYGKAHLAVGYATLAAMGVAVGAIVF
jgi:hypothetical protein